MMPVESFAPAHLICVGPFARAIAQYLKMVCPLVTETHVDDTVPSPSTWPNARLNVLVAWRPVPDLCDLLNRISYELRRPFLPVIQDLAVLRVGPIIAPGHGPCWHCWITRWRQHSGWTKERSSVLDYYRAHRTAGPQGYLEPFAKMAATLIAQTMASIESSTAIPGYIWQIDMITRSVSTAVVVGVHDCSWCGLGRPKETRSFAALQEQLSFLAESQGKG